MEPRVFGPRGGDWDARQVQRRMRRVSVSTAGPRRRPWPTWACTPCSTGARRARASPRPTASGSVCPAAWLRGRRVQRTRSCRTRGLHGHRGTYDTRTAGESRLANAQPILIECAHGQIAVCHNGNLVNQHELRDDLVSRGSIFQTSSDTEVFLHLYARVEGRHGRRRHLRRGVPGAGGILARVHDEGPARRRPRSSRVQAAGARATW